MYYLMYSIRSVLLSSNRVQHGQLVGQHGQYMHGVAAWINMDIVWVPSRELHVYSRTCLDIYLIYLVFCVNGLSPVSG